MVSIVIVSHSEKVAAGAAEIAAEMNTANIPIVAAGGTGDGRIGTNAELIAKAINSVFSGDEILVFADLGSSILSTEMAMDLLDPAVAKHVRIVDAPVVEGTVVAAIQAGITENADEIAEVAEGAKLIPKVHKD